MHFLSHISLNCGKIGRMERGILKTNGVHLEEHEYATVKLLLELGYNVELIPTSQVKGMRTPDISINGVLWEIVRIP